MPPRLVSLEGRGHILLDRVLIVVGRHRRCDVALDSLRVSRQHCCLALDVDRVLVRDLGSRNGTWINDTRIDEGVLQPGDELRIGHLRYALDLEAREDGRATESRTTAASPHSETETLPFEPADPSAQP